MILGSVLTTADARRLPSCRRRIAPLASWPQAGVKFAFGTGSYQRRRGSLPYEAAISVAWGLDRDKALRAITIEAAEILGVADRVGSLEAGKVANLAIWNGDPLELRTAVPRVFIAGRDVGPDSKHTELYERCSNRPLPARK